MNEIQDPQYKSADGSALRIWRDTAKNNFLCGKLGRPIFDEVIYVEVISPGSRDSTPVFECVRIFAAESEFAGTPLYGMKYDEYKSFIADFEKSEEIDSTLAGTPLAQWPEMTRTMVAALKAQNIFTVDALANLPDGKLLVVGPDGRTWREKAKAYIETAKSGAYATELAAKLETSELEKATMADQIKQLASQISALQAQVNGAASAKPGKAATPAAVIQSEDPAGAALAAQAAASDPAALAAQAAAALSAPGETLVPAPII